jgi:hypothetical protein
MFSLFPALLIRKNIALGLLLGFSVLGGLYVWAGPAATWRLWQVPSGGPPFMDVRVITDGVIAHRKGLDPLRDNVGDVSQRRLNYPRIWQSLYGLGVDESSANAIGLVMVLLFAVGVVLVAPGQTPLAVGGMLLAVFSPAVILGIERGNTDLLMFFLLALALALRRFHGVWAWGVVMVAFGLKLFPLAGLVLLLGRGRKVALVGIVAGAAGGLLYVLFILYDLILIKQATPQGAWISYGLGVVSLWVAEGHAGWGRVVWVLSLLAAVGVLVLGFLRRGSAAASEEGASLDAFRVSVAIYAGTFLLGTNFDYRQVFLLFAIPQLQKWSAGGSAGRGLLARMGLAGIYVSLWTLMAEQWLAGRDVGALFAFGVGELAQWSVFAVLVRLFCRTLPDWIGRNGNELKGAMPEADSA